MDLLRRLTFRTFIVEAIMKGCYYKKTTYYGNDEKRIVKCYAPNLGNHAPRSRNIKEVSEKIKRLEKANHEHRLQNLYGLIKCNFFPGDYHICLRYNLPPKDKQKAKKYFENFLKRMRRAHKKNKTEFYYIANTEESQKHKIHHHMIIRKEDLPLVKEKWKYGIVHINSRLWSNGDYWALAKYFTDRSKGGKSEELLDIGENSYTCSKNLKRPKVTYERIRASRWIKIPRAPKGWYIDKSSVRELCDGSGWNYQCYTIKRLC